MKKKLFLFVICLFFLVGLGFLIFNFSTPKAPPAPSVQIGITKYTVEVADTDAKRTQGLSGKLSLPVGTGMLFIFPTKAQYGFWMPNMHFAIDIIWIDGDKIVHIEENVPPSQPGQTQLPTYRPAQPADKVLELNAGEVAKYSFKVGQKIKAEDL